MTINIKTEVTSAGRVVNNLRIDIDSIFAERYGPRWLDYRTRWKNASKMESLEEFPLFVRFETQFKCNGRCRMCAHGHADLRADYSYDDVLSFKTFARLVDECARYECPSVGMSQTNEPLLDPDLIKRIRYAADKGIMDIHLNTNASLLTEEMSEKLISSGITRMLVSIDAVTEETFKKIRPGLDFHAILKNLEYFLSLREKMGTRYPIVRVSFLLQEENAAEEEAFKKHWVDKVDYVSVQRYVPISPFNDHRSRAIEQTPIRGEQHCSYPFESLFIHGDGMVVPCAAHRARHISVGNIHNNTIHEIWHSFDIEKLREALRTGDLSETKLCQTCLF